MSNKHDTIVEFYSCQYFLLIFLQDDCSDSSLETESYLRTTEQVVSDMFARAANHNSKPVDSGDSDCEPGPQVNGKTIPDHHSDSSCSETVPTLPSQRRSLIDKTSSTSSNNKYNRAFR